MYLRDEIDAGYLSIGSILVAILFVIGRCYFTATDIITSFLEGIFEAIQETIEELKEEEAKEDEEESEDVAPDDLSPNLDVKTS